ncbi:unnamed protein product [Rhizophagus irregularis]|nr:unnamed protein product [Rhizophagus irregularis]CAB5377897.1 unnamed protein product [Rhizophagus irregularis]
MGNDDNNMDDDMADLKKLTSLVILYFPVYLCIPCNPLSSSINYKLVIIISDLKFPYFDYKEKKEECF